MNSNLTKIENVYHLKNIGVFQEKIIVPNIISDHQILIFTKEIPIPLNPEYEDIIIQDKNTIQRNLEQLNMIANNQDHIPTFISPAKQIKVKRHQLNFSNLNYLQNYEEIKNHEKERFKEIKRKKVSELISLLEHNILGREPQQKLAALMRLKTKIAWWKSHSMEERQTITSEFKELYKHKNIQQENPISLANSLIIILDNIMVDNNSMVTPPPQIPKSRARDINGFSQREILQLIRGKNLNDTALRAKFNPKSNFLSVRKHTHSQYK